MTKTHRTKGRTMARTMAEAHIYLREWDINYTEFVNWVKENNAEITATTTSLKSANRYDGYKFANESDYVAFSLAFARRGNNG